MTWLWYTIAGALGFLALATLAGGYIGFKFALMRKKEVPQLQDPDPMAAHRAAEQAAGQAWLFAHSPEDVQLQSRDGLKLRGYFLPAPKPSKRLVVCVHGYRFPGDEQFGAFLPFYHDEMNCHVLLPDHRAYGRSDGKYIGFSALEWEDIFDWTGMFVKRLGPDTQVALHGISMGAATVMNCNALGPPDYIKCVVEDCGFTNGYEMIALVARRDLHLRFPPMNWAVALWFRVFQRCSLRKDADPYGNIAKFKLPTLFIHGAGDRFVPAEMGRRCYEAASVPKELLLVEGAGHSMAYFMAKEAYEARVRGWLARWVGETVTI
jgi:pimeloyl-ACP methyl ester carboxylesterase